MKLKHTEIYLDKMSISYIKSARLSENNSSGNWASPLVKQLCLFRVLSSSVLRNGSPGPDCWKPDYANTGKARILIWVLKLYYSEVFCSCYLTFCFDLNSQVPQNTQNKSSEKHLDARKSYTSVNFYNPGLELTSSFTTQNFA